MQVLQDDQLDQVAGGFVWAAAAVFVFVNLEKLNDCLQGLVDGFNAGLEGPNGASGTSCTP